MPGEVPGSWFGPFKLLQKIGEGGFGMVWMAEQREPIFRKVAIKVIKAGMDTKEVLARFEAERQALAMMDHPHIAKVLDAGATPSGRPWFAMELVRGVPITEFCDEQKLRTEERLKLFGDVCAAISHAHQKGIIHRDIKPSNVLVTRDGCPESAGLVKVIDFGIAKATQSKLTDKTLFTAFEQIIGTPVYMSPEQTGLGWQDVDTRSDIYSLGAVLYELLTGQPLFNGKTLAAAGYDEMRRIIREQEPPRPSLRLSTISDQDETTRIRRVQGAPPQKLSRLARGELDWIVMKALDKERARRYETASAFAADIARYLAHEPVEAGPPSAFYRFRKFARRNKAVIGTATLIATIILAATGVSISQAVEAHRARTRAEADKEQAQAITDFLIEVFQSPRQSTGRSTLVADVLARAAERLETELTVQPERQATLRDVLARTCVTTSLYPLAIELGEKSLKWHRIHSGPEHRATLETMALLSQSYVASGRKDEGIALLEEAIEIGRQAYGEGDLWSLERMIYLSNYYSSANRTADALELAEEVLDSRRKTLGPDHPATRMAANVLASHYESTGRHEESIPIREEALAFQLKTYGTEHRGTPGSMSNLGQSYINTGQLDKGLALLEEALILGRKLDGDTPNTALLAEALSEAYLKAGRLDEALRLREEIQTTRRKVLGLENPMTLKAMELLATSYLDLDRIEEGGRLLVERLRGDSRRTGGDQRGRQTDEEITAEVIRVFRERNIALVEKALPEESLIAYFNTHRDRFAETRLHLLTISGKKPEKDRAFMESLRDRLGRGETWKAVAGAASDDSSASFGGDLGWVNRADLGEDLWKAAFALEPGQISGVIEDETRFLLLKVVGREKGEPPTSLDQVRVAVTEAVVKDEEQARVRRWIDEVDEEAAGREDLGGEKPGKPGI